MALILCAWCGGEIGENPEIKGAIGTHGICSRCSEVEMRKMDERNAAIKKSEELARASANRFNDWKWEGNGGKNDRKTVNP